jgi:hypothetical protein
VNLLERPRPKPSFARAFFPVIADNRLDNRSTDHAPAFSKALFGWRTARLLPAATIAPHYVRTVADRDGFVQVFVDRYRTSRQRAAESGLVDLPRPVPDGHGVVPECQRYLRVRSALLEIFGDAQRPQAEELPALAKAA